MALHKIKDFDPDYIKHFNEGDIKGLDVYSGQEKIGSVEDLLVDDNGKFRYFIISTGGWLAGKKVMLPIGRARVDYHGKRVYADNLAKSQAEALPEFSEDLRIDYDREEQVRSVYRTAQPNPQRTATTGAAPMLALEDEYAEIDGTVRAAAPAPKPQPRETYQHEQEPDLYAMNEQNHPSFKLYEERLVSSKTRQKTGETVISKRVETETATASVPIEKERVTIERVPGNAQTAVAPGEATFKEGEVSRVEVYEDVPEFRKEAFVREEVRVNKVVDNKTATAQETIRREEVDVDTQGNPVVKNQ